MHGSRGKGMLRKNCEIVRPALLTKENYNGNGTDRDVLFLKMMVMYWQYYVHAFVIIMFRTQ
jgi:hypothetical protein